MPGNHLPAWNDGAAKRTILDFVARVTRDGSRDFVPVEGRVAVFDNDGTLWCEKPLPIQADFLLRRVGEMAARDPALRSRQPWKSVVEKDHAWLGGVITKHYHGDDEDLKVMAAGILAAYAGSTIDEYEAAGAAFFKTAQHPVRKRSYRECTYRPMVELLRYLEAHGFQSYIVTGGGRDFVCLVAPDLYGIPAERVIGSSAALAYRDDGDVASIFHKPELDVFDDGPAKPVQIWSRTGRRPILAAGNSNGDIPMLHFSAPSRPWLSLLVDHDDEQREYAYRAGAETSLERARAHGWTVISMKNDWKTVFAGQ